MAKSNKNSKKSSGLSHGKKVATAANKVSVAKSPQTAYRLAGRNAASSAYATLSRAEESEALAEQGRRMQQDPAYGMRLLKEAGIVDKNGKLSSDYKASK